MHGRLARCTVVSAARSGAAWCALCSEVPQVVSPGRSCVPAMAMPCRCHAWRAALRRVNGLHGQGFNAGTGKDRCRSKCAARGSRQGRGLACRAPAAVSAAPATLHPPLGRPQAQTAMKRGLPRCSPGTGRTRSFRFKMHAWNRGTERGKVEIDAIFLRSTRAVMPPKSGSRTLRCTSKKNRSEGKGWGSD